MSFIKITCTVPGRRRAGQPHEAVKTWPADTFSTEQLAVLKADPAFTLEWVAVESVVPAAAELQVEDTPVTLAGGWRRADELHRWLVTEVTAIVLRAVALGDTVDQFTADVRRTYEIYREGRSGTAREAPSTGSGSDAAGAAGVFDGVQPAAPQQPELADPLTEHGSGASASSTNTEGAPPPVPSTGDAPDEAAAIASEGIGSDGVSSADDGAAEESGKASEGAAAAPSEPTPKTKARRVKATD